MKKNLFLIMLSIVICFGSYAQRLRVETSIGIVPAQYKKHYSHSIEGGMVDGELRQFVAGNKTDMLNNSLKITGHAFNAAAYINGQICNNPYDHEIQLTDFTILPSDDYKYGAGTGVYYPYGITGMGYPYIGLYDKTTMEVVKAYYYTLTYTGIQDPANSVGVRIVYSEIERAFYVSGIISDQLFADINMNNIVGKSKGFIMRVEEDFLTTPQVLVFEPYDLGDEDPTLSIITDLEINSDDTEIAFTGMSTVSDAIGFNGNYHPVVGVIDMDLNVQWYNTFNFNANRYSGIDVEYNTSTDDIFVLINSQRYEFSIMEVEGTNGTIVQQPHLYSFYSSDIGSARAHKLHYNNGSLDITGNCFVAGYAVGSEDQLLFHYQITNASDISAGNTLYDVYARDEVPTGDQKEVTGYWAPENSILQDGEMSIVGVCNNNNQTFGYTLIHLPGWQNTAEDCLEWGEVDISTFSTEITNQETDTDECGFVEIVIDSDPDEYIGEKDCPASESDKSLAIEGQEICEVVQMVQTERSGISAILNSETEEIFNIEIYDIMGRKVVSQNIYVDGSKEVLLEFEVKPIMYIVNVSTSNAAKSIKVMGK